MDTPENENKHSAVNVSIRDIQHPLLYSDQIHHFALGPVVTKLLFAVEMNDKEVSPVASMVIPTASLIQAISFIMKTLAENEELTEKLIEENDKFREVLLKLSKGKGKGKEKG